MLWTYDMSGYPKETIRDTEDLKGALKKVNNVQNDQKQPEGGLSKETAVLMHFIQG